MKLVLPGSLVRPFSTASAIFYKCSHRYWAAHRWQAVLMLVGMALGVAVVFAVDIANQSAKRAFSLSLDAVTGRTTHQITGPADGFDESAYIKLRTQLGFRRSAPVIEGTTTLSGKSGQETLQILGVDLFAEPMFRNQLVDNADHTGDRYDEFQSARDSLALLAAGAVVLGSATADRLGVEVGDFVDVAADSMQSRLKLISTIDTNRQAAFESIAMVDISTAQNLLGLAGKLSRIDLLIETRQEKEMIEQAFPALQVVDAARRNNALQQMTQAFHTNLLAMSLLALLVGAFLIYNTVTLSVLQRRTLFGQLRVCGVQRRELFGSVIWETLFFAIIGTVFGLVVGYLLGGLLLQLVTRTINDLYFTLDVRRLDVSVFSVVKALFIGLSAALLAALAPAWEASNSSPATVLQRSSLETRTSAIVPGIFIFGLMMIVIGVVIIGISHHSLWAGFVALFFIVIGYSLMIPQALIVIARFGQLVSRSMHQHGRAMGQYPLRSLTASLSRTSVAIAALVVAVSATAGVGIMIGSFRLSVSDWLSNTLQADIYIRDAGSRAITLPVGLKDKVENLNGVSALRWTRLIDAETDFAPARLLAVDSNTEHPDDLKFADKINQPRVGRLSNDRKIDSDQRRQLFLKSNGIYVSEPYARTNDVLVGDAVNFATDAGDQEFIVAGIFTDYGAGKGLLIMAMDNYHRYWNDRDITSIGVTIDPAVDADSVKRALRPLLQSYPAELLMRSNIEIREMSLEIFDRTFAITHVLRLLTVGVAFVGILSALIALSLERRSEFAVLRALGITPLQLRNLLFVQTGLMGLIAGVLALPLGVAMSQILVSVINLRSFGWTMEFHVPIKVMIESLLLAIVAAFLAGWYPAHKLGRLSPAEALRHQ